MLRIQTCVLAALLSSSLACDNFDSDGAEIERSSAAPDSCSNAATGSGWLVEILEDRDALLSVDDLDGLELAIVIDPDSLAKDIAGVGVSTAMIQIDDPAGSALKIKLKIVVLPAGPIAD